MKDFSKKSTKKIVVWVLNLVDMEIDFLIVLVIMYYRAILKTSLAGFARVCRDSLGFKRTLFNYLLEGAL